MWPKKPIFHRFASSSLGSSERSMVTPHFLFRFCCAMVPDTQILPASVLHWTRNWSNGAHWLVGFFFCFGGKSSYGVITEGCTHRIRSKSVRTDPFVRSLHGVKTEVVRTLVAIYGDVLVCVRMLLSNRLTPFVRLS